jgi:hypothetical protein
MVSTGWEGAGFVNAFVVLAKLLAKLFAKVLAKEELMLPCVCHAGTWGNGHVL